MGLDSSEAIFLKEKRRVLQLVRKHPGKTCRMLAALAAENAFQHKRLVKEFRLHLRDLEEARKVFRGTPDPVTGDTWWAK